MTQFPGSVRSFFRRCRPSGVGAAVSALLLLPGCVHRPPPDGARAVILVTLDTFRAGILGASGDPVTRTPHLDRLARRGLQWTGAVSPVPLTTPSHATILSGLVPATHGVLKNRMVLRSDVPTVPEILQGLGYRTGAIVSRSAVLAARFGLSRGFDTYDVVEPEDHPSQSDGAETTAAALRWLERRGGPGSFLWVHYFDAHIPYLPPSPLDVLYDPDYEGRFARPDQPYQEYFQSDDVDPRDVQHLVALYSGAVTYLDRCVGDLLRGDEAQDAIVLVTADHGEGLWEHERYFGHDTILYDTALRVPLIVAGAGRAGLRAEPASTLDAAPTLLRRCGVTPPAGMEGRDLFDDTAAPTARLVVETHPTRSKGGAVFGARDDRAKVIWAEGDDRWHAFDLAADPRELHDLGTAAGGVFADLAELLQANLKERDLGEILTVDDEAGGMDEATREALQTLGYVE